MGTLGPRERGQPGVHERAVRLVPLVATRYICTYTGYLCTYNAAHPLFGSLGRDEQGARCFIRPNFPDQHRPLASYTESGSPPGPTHGADHHKSEAHQIHAQLGIP